MRREIGGVVALVCAIAFGWEAQAESYASCATASDPPSCIVGQAGPDADGDDLLEGVIMAGAMSAIDRHATALSQEAQTEALKRNAFADAMGIKLPADPAVEQVSNFGREVALAAVALAAAAQISDDPFSEPVAQRLIAAARNHPAIAQIAVTLWDDIDTYSEWDGDNVNTRPRGMSVVWRAVIAQPPANNDVLISIANMASANGYAAEGLALLRVALTRTALSNENRASIASQFARWHRLPDDAQRLLDDGGTKATGWYIPGIEASIARARLRRGYDAAAAKIVVDASLKDIGRRADYDSQENLAALEAAAAKPELMSLGDAYLARARQLNPNAEDQGQWFALASESYRRGGDKPKALAAAREGMPFVEPAVSARIARLTNPPKTKRAAAVVAAGFGIAPVIALYRAGAIEEAVSAGYLIGYERYMNAEVAGEEPDPQWVVDDHDSRWTDIVERYVIERDKVKDARRYYDALRCTSHFGPNRQSELQSLLGPLAALIGGRSSMLTHFGRVLALVDRPDSDTEPSTRAYFALKLAADWRRGLVIAERKAAQADSFATTACR